MFHRSLRRLAARNLPTCLRRPIGSREIFSALWVISSLPGRLRIWMHAVSAERISYTWIKAASGCSLRRKTNEHTKPNRVDRANLESDGRVHKDIARLQKLLRRDHGQAPASHGHARLREWLPFNAHARASVRTAGASETDGLLR